MSNESPRTHRTVEGECYKLCKCSECGVVATCTPIFDFFVRGHVEGESQVGKPLICETCLDRGLRAEGVTTIFRAIATKD